MTNRTKYFSSHGEQTVQCTLCPHRCVLKPQKKGLCGTRYARDGHIEVLTHRRVAAAAVDPVEKKPLFHFLPGTTTFSVGARGCNMKCPFCQNAGLSQCSREIGATHEETSKWSPEDVVEQALQHRCDTISFTYSEPVLSLEFAAEVSQVAKKEGIEIIFVTNGQINKGPLDDLKKVVSAVNVDLKAFSKETYSKILGGDLDATLETVSELHRAGIWVEVTTLVVSGLNDSEEELGECASFIGSLSCDIPWHVSRFHPSWKWKHVPDTPVETMERAVRTGYAKGLNFVYTGNLPGNPGETTKCPKCDETLIKRNYYSVANAGIEGGRCASCGFEIAGRWKN